jgi:transketolase
LQEGQNWEAILYASAKKIDNIICTIDLNGKQIDGETDDVLHMGDVKKKFEAFDWDVLEVKEGNDVEVIKKGLADAKSRTGKGKPVCILLYTEMGNGVDFMMHTHAWHGKAPNDDQLEVALAQNPATLGDY